MTAKTIVNWIVACAALCMVGVIFFGVQQASANSGGFCQSNTVANKAVNACEYGFTNAGNITGQMCENYPTPREAEACLEGYGQALSIDEQKRIDNSERCNVPGLGWIVCWVSKFLARLADGLFAVLEQLMVVAPLDQNEDGGRELYAIWGMFRNVANVVFVVVLLIVIMSHVSSMGMQNYAIKRTMPRIIVGALLINLSFIICGLVVDATNILGDALKGLMQSVAIPVQPQFSSWDSVVAVGLLGVGGLVVYLNIFAIGPIIFSGIIALLLTVVILVVRHTLIVVLVIISPLAFALNILPSTQKWFSKWWSTFFLLAMVYPVIAFIFGGTQVAAGVISVSAPSGTIGTIIFGTFALGVQSIPFFITPLLLKVGGGLLNRFTGIINDPSKGLIDKGKNRVDQWSKNKTNVRETNALTGASTGLHAAITRQNSRRGKIADYHKKQLSSPTSGTYGKFVSSEENRERIANNIARNVGESKQEAVAQRIQGELTRVAAEIDVTDIDAAEATWIDKKSTFSDMKAALESGSHSDGTALTDDERAAAYKRIASASGDNVDQIHELMDEVAQLSDGSKAALALADGIDASGVAASAAHLDKTTTNTMRKGAMAHQPIQNSTQAMAQAANRGVFGNATTLSRQSAGTNAKLAQAHSASLLNPEAHANLVSNRSLIDNNEKLRVNQSAQARQNLTGL